MIKHTFNFICEKNDFLSYFRASKNSLDLFDGAGRVFFFIKQKNSKWFTHNFFNILKHIINKKNKTIHIFLIVQKIIDKTKIKNAYFARHFINFFSKLSPKEWQVIHSWIVNKIIYFGLSLESDDIMKKNNFILFFKVQNNKNNFLIVENNYKLESKVIQHFDFDINLKKIEEILSTLTKYFKNTYGNLIDLNYYVLNETITYLNLPSSRAYLKKFCMDYLYHFREDIFAKINEKIILVLNLYDGKIKNKFYNQNRALINTYIDKVDLDKLKKIIYFKKRLDQNFFNIFRDWKQNHFYISHTLEWYFKSIKKNWYKYIKRSEETKESLLNDEGFWKKEWNSLNLSGYLSTDREPLKLQIKQMLFALKLKKTLNFSVPGSGKTTIALLLSYFLKKNKKIEKTFIFAPCAAFNSWREEFSLTFKNKEKPKILNLSIESSKNKIEKLKFDLKKYDYIIMHYATAAKNYVNEQLKELIDNKTLIIIDEAHYIKGGRAWGKNITQLTKKASFALLMTGTPIPKGINDAYNFLEIILGTNFKVFFSGLEPLEQRKLFPSLYFRINYKDLQIDFTPELEEVPYSLSEDQIDEIKNIRNYAKKIVVAHKGQELFKKEGQIQKIRQIYSSLNLYYGKSFTENESQKMQKLLEILKREQITKKKMNVLIWCEFKKSIISLEKCLKRYLKNYPIKIYKHYGQTSQEERVDQIMKYKKHGGILIASLGTLSEAVSLHKETDFTIYFEYNFDLIDWMQSRFRTFRYGITKNPKYYVLVSEGRNPASLEKRILEILRIKTDFQKELLSNADKNTKEEIKNEILKWIEESGENNNDM